MKSTGNGSHRFEIKVSDAIAEEIRRLHRQAKQQGRGPLFTLTPEQIVRVLRTDPMNAGEPAYRLPSLDLDVRSAVMRPLVIDFAVSQQQQSVYIKGVKLMSPEIGK